MRSSGVRTHHSALIIQRFCPVYPANAAGAEHADAVARGDPHRRRYGGSAGPAACDRDRQVAAREFVDVVAGGESLQLSRGQAGAQLAVHDGDSPRKRTVVASDLLQPLRGRQILRVRQAVGDEGRFESKEGVGGLHVFVPYVT